MAKSCLKIIKTISKLLILLSIAVLSIACFMITQPFVIKIETQPKVASLVRLEQHVRHLSETLYPRNYTETANLNASADYILQIFKQTSTTVTEQTFEIKGRSYRNILAHFGPKHGEALVIGAHYDTHGNTPGADDNASGVAGLLELAEMLKDTPPQHPVTLIAYTLEEPPFFGTNEMGSAIHANSLKAEGKNIKLMISLEMIGYFSDNPNSQSYPIDLLHILYPSKGNFIGIVGRFSEQKETRHVKALMRGATTLPVISINAPTFVHGLDFSDHRNYWQQGFPALMITDTAFFRNNNYHQLTDTADTLDYIRMAQVVQAVYAVIHGF